MHSQGRHRGSNLASNLLKGVFILFHDVPYRSWWFMVAWCTEVICGKLRWRG